MARFNLRASKKSLRPRVIMCKHSYFGQQELGGDDGKSTVGKDTITGISISNQSAEVSRVVLASLMYFSTCLHFSICDGERKR
jgi:hypothetical protein